MAARHVKQSAGLEQLGQVEQEREQWQAAATAGLMHLSEPIDTLMQRRSSLREALRTWRRFDPDTSRYVVVIGPAGAGKSTFIKQQLSDHGYTDLAKTVVVSDAGVGTTHDYTYNMDNHGVLLQDSVGDAAAELLQGKAVAADVLVVFLGQGCRGERIHGDAAVLAYHLRQRMKTIFVVSKTDTAMLEGCVDGEINCANVKVFLRKLRRQAATELQRTLLCSVKAHTSGKTPPVVVMEDTNSILQIARVMCPQEWCDHVERTNWLDVVCYWRGTALTGGGGRSPKLQPVQAEAMRIELEKLEQLVYPARSLSVARNDLVRDVTRHI